MLIIWLGDPSVCSKSLAATRLNLAWKFTNRFWCEYLKVLLCSEIGLDNELSCLDWGLQGSRQWQRRLRLRTSSFLRPTTKPRPPEIEMPTHKMSPAEAKYMQYTDVCNKSPLLHGLENQNLLARFLSPEDHLPSEGGWRSIEVQCLEATDIQSKPPPKEIPRGKMPITKLAWEELALCALPSSWASLGKGSQKISQQPIH